MTVLVTCVMLCHWPDREAMIADALRSYDQQTHRERELLVVNDGYPLLAARPDVQVLNLVPGLTLGAKRTEALYAARGDWVATWDDDDYSFPERVAVLVAAAWATGACSARFRAIWMADQDLRIGGLVPVEGYQAGVVLRDAALAVGGYPPISYLEDMELSMRLAARGLRTARSDAALYVQRRHAGSVTAGRESLADHLRRALPQANARIPGAQQRLDSLRKAPCDTLVVPA